MKIKKTFQGVIPENKILNAESTSQTDTYSCDYINSTSIIVSPTEPQGKNRKKVWIQKGKNLFDKKLITKTAYFNSSGEILVNSANFAISDYIEVAENCEYVYQGLTNVGIDPHSVYYDKDKNFLSSFKQATGENVITIPEGACYVRFSIDIRAEYQDEETFQFEQGNVSSDYEAYIEPTIYIKNRNDIYEKFIKKDEGEVYSTEEVRIGTWTDGKPLYRKVIKVTPTISNSEYSKYEFTHKITNIDVITKVDAFTKNNYGETWPLPNMSSSSSGTGIKSVDRTKVIIYSMREGWSGWDFYITLEYTKTTD